MTPMVKLILVLLGLAYLISPADAIPEMYLPWVGWIDDSLVMLCLYHLLRYGRLPDFLFKKGRKQSSQKKSQGPNATGTFKKEAPNRSSGRPGPTGRSAKQSRSSNTSSPNFAHDTCYDILGVDKSASWEQIHTAYKNKIKQYHPDKLSHLGEEFSNLANEKFLEIQQAYATLKSIKNQ